MVVDQRFLRRRPLVKYHLFDKFPDNGDIADDDVRSCKPGPGQLTFTENDGDWTIANQRLEYTAQATPAVNDLMFYSSAFARRRGVLLVSDIALNQIAQMGFGVSDKPEGAYWVFDSSSEVVKKGEYIGGAWQSDRFSTLEPFTPDDDYEIATVLLATGNFLLIKGGAEFTEWTLLYWVEHSSTAQLRVFVENRSGAGALDNLRVAYLPRWTPTPLLSDSFDRGDSTNLGSTDGAAMEVSGGDGVAWQELNSSDWEIASNKLSPKTGTPSEPSFVAACDAGQADLVARATVNQSSGAGTQGIAVRVPSGVGTMFVVGIRPGSNAFVIMEWNGSTWTDRATNTSAAINLSTDYDITVVCDGSAISGYLDGGRRVRYDSATVGQTETLIGLRAEVLTVTFDDFRVFRRLQPTFPAYV